MKIQCPSCGKAYGVSSEMVGRTAVCPGCSSKFKVPNPYQSSDPPAVKLRENVKVVRHESSWSKPMVVGAFFLLIGPSLGLAGCYVAARGAAEVIESDIEANQESEQEVSAEGLALLAVQDELHKQRLTIESMRRQLKEMRDHRLDDRKDIIVLKSDSKMMMRTITRLINE